MFTLYCDDGTYEFAYEDFFACQVCVQVNKMFENFQLCDTDCCDGLPLPPPRLFLLCVYVSWDGARRTTAHKELARAPHTYDRTIASTYA